MKTKSITKNTKGTEDETEVGRDNQRVSQGIQNETEEETEARREDAKQNESQRVQNETKGETEPIILYLYLIQF